MLNILQKTTFFTVFFDQTFGTEKWKTQTFSTKKKVRPDLLTDLSVLTTPNCDTYYHKVLYLENQAQPVSFKSTRTEICCILHYVASTLDRMSYLGFICKMKCYTGRSNVPLFVWVYTLYLREKKSVNLIPKRYCMCFIYSWILLNLPS